MDVRSIPDRWRRADVTVRDLPLALVLFAVPSLLPVWNGYGTRLGALPQRPFDAWTVLTVGLEALPLIGRRRWPAACLALVSLGFAADQLRGYHTVAGTALPIALLSVAAHLERHRLLVAGLATAAYVPLAVALERRGAGEGLVGYTTFYLALAIAWGAGSWLRVSRAAEAERRRHVAEATRTLERTRIARELHDVVTHHVTAMVVQAESARYLTAAPERLDQTLTAIAGTGRRAIADLRHLLDLLNPDHGPAPSVGELSSLVEQTRQAGQPVEFTQDGGPPETPGSAEVTAYRVVQEALTNALKHDHGSPTVVDVHYGSEDISVEVTSAGSGMSTPASGGGGRGLTGLRERVALLGGEFTAGRRPGGGFVVRARIPAPRQP